MRLIDTDAMNEELFYKQIGGKNTLITVESAFNMIKAQPTAYDLDNVVSQMYKLKKHDNKYDEYYDNTMYKMKEFENNNVNSAIDKAIEIVKRGGLVELSEHCQSESY